MTGTPDSFTDFPSDSDESQNWSLGKVKGIVHPTPVARPLVIRPIISNVLIICSVLNHHHHHHHHLI